MHQHQVADHWATDSAIENAVLTMRPGGQLVIECLTDANCYAQVWWRPDGELQLEYRDGAPAEHYQTLTASRDEVASALTGWAAGATAWRERFVWTNIGSWFTD